MRSKFTNHAKNILSLPGITVLMVGLAIVGRIIQLIYFYSIRFDGSYQAIATQNWLEGHGITIGEVFAQDLSATVYQPLINWPPGYSVLLAPFYWIYGGNYIAAGLTLDIIAAIVLIYFTRRILQIFNVPLYLINLFTLINGFFIYYFYLVASSDAIAISLFCVALYFMWIMIRENSHPLRNITIVVIILFICAATKYLFIPVIFIVPLFLYLNGRWNSNVYLRKAGILSFFILLVAIGTLLAWQKMISGSAAHISQPGSGFFPEHLADAYPFIPAAFLQPESIGILAGASSEPGTLVYRIFQLIHLLLGILVIFSLVRYLRVKKVHTISLSGRHLILTAGICLIIVGLLSALSLFVPMEQILPGWYWTYVGEPRYYGLAIILLQLALIILISSSGYSPSKKFRTFLMLLLAFLFLEMARGLLFTGKRLANYGQEEYHWQYEYRFQQYADSVLQHARNNDMPAAVTGSSHYMNNRVSLYSNIPVLNQNALLNDLAALQAKSPMLLLVIIHEKEFTNFKSFTSTQLPVGQYEGYYFFTLYVKPN
jgi:hypothetical protein